MPIVSDSAIRLLVFVFLNVVSVDSVHNASRSDSYTSCCTNIVTCTRNSIGHGSRDSCNLMLWWMLPRVTLLNL